jgi:hypothetical protein
MHAAGIALFLFATAVTAPNVHYAVLPPPPRVVSPDPAPPHPLKPRDPESARFDTPSVALARVLGALAKGVLRDHGH